MRTQNTRAKHEIYSPFSKSATDHSFFFSTNYDTYLHHHARYPNSQLLTDMSIMTCVVTAAVPRGLHVPAYTLAITVKARRVIGKKKERSRP